MIKKKAFRMTVELSYGREGGGFRMTVEPSYGRERVKEKGGCGGEAPPKMGGKAPSFRLFLCLYSCQWKS